MNYPGSKNADGVWHRIVNQMPPHRCYIEAFLGSAAILRRKKPAALNIGIERDPRTLQEVKPLLSSHDVRLICGDALALLPAMPETAAPDTLLYADPPYLLSARSWQGQLYRHELTTPDEHSALLDILDALPCMVVLSGYASKLYCRRLRAPKWRTVTFQAATHRGVRTEVLWMNFPDPIELHDYAYLGDDFTDRQRIKRKAARWTAKLRNMPAKERHAVFAACELVKSELASQAR